MKIILSLFIAIISFSAYAQPGTRFKGTPMITRGIGISIQEFGGLNSRIDGRPEFRALRDYAGTLDLGFMNVYKRFISGPDLTAGSSMSGDRGRRSSVIHYIGAGIDIGYDLIPNESIMLYPLIGIGGQAYQARFFRDVSTTNLNDVLQSSAVQNNIRPVDFTNSFFTYRLGIGFTVKSPRHNSGAFGVQAGYTGSFRDERWKGGDNQELAGAPEDRLSQFHVSLIFNCQPHFMR